MKKYALFLTAISIIVLGSCSKKSGSSASIPYSGIGGYGMGAIRGLFDITLAKNADTTIQMPIIVSVTVYGNWDPLITIKYSKLPTDLISVTPSTDSVLTIITNSNSYVTDSTAFHIRAVDTGSFAVTITASTNGGNPSQVSDSFKIIVH